MIQQMISPRKREKDFRVFEELMSQTQAKVYLMAYRLTRNREDAFDLVQETYLKAWRNFQLYVRDRSFLNWILRIMQRLYIDQKRRRSQLPKAEFYYSLNRSDPGEIHELDVADTGPSPEEKLLSQELDKEVVDVFGALPKVYRHAIFMCDVQGLSYNEIARKQQTTIGTVRSRIHRGRKLMRQILQEKGFQSLSYAVHATF